MSAPNPFPNLSQYREKIEQGWKAYATRLSKLQYLYIEDQEDILHGIVIAKHAQIPPERATTLKIVATHVITMSTLFTNSHCHCYSLHLCHSLGPGRSVESRK